MITKSDILISGQFGALTKQKNSMKQKTKVDGRWFSESVLTNGGTQKIGKNASKKDSGKFLRFLFNFLQISLTLFLQSRFI